jgi:invasion protein IalB
MTGPHRTKTRSGHNYARLAFATLLLAAVASVAPNQQAASQQNSTTAPKPGATEVAPRGQRDVKDVTYGDWRKLCFKPGGAKLSCRTSITGTFSTGQMAVRLDIIEREGDHTARLQLFAPVGMYLPAGVKLTVDQGTSYQVPYNWCLTNACIASEVADPKMVQEMAWRTRCGWNSLIQISCRLRRCCRLSSSRRSTRARRRRRSSRTLMNERKIV